jgi:hypothetical protein
MTGKAWYAMVIFHLALGIIPLTQAYASWVTQVIDNQGDVGRQNAIAVDSAGDVHIVYRHSQEFLIKYAHSSQNQGWLIDSIRNDAAGGTAIAIDALRFPHIVYVNAQTEDLQYGFWDGVKWNFEIANAVGSWTREVSLALGPTNVPFFSAYQFCNSLDHCDTGSPQNTAHLYLFDKSGGFWSSRLVDPTSPDVRPPDQGEFGKSNSLAFAPDGTIHVSYNVVNAFVGSQELKYATIDGQTITRTVVDDGSSGDPGIRSVIRLDSSERPRIAYWVGVEPNLAVDLRYAAWNGTMWTTETIDPAAGVGVSVSLLIGPSDVPHVAYYDRVNQAVKYASRSASGWVVETVTPVGAYGGGQNIGLAIGADGRPLISYYDAASARLNVAYRDAADRDGDGIPDPIDQCADDADCNSNGILDGQDTAVHTYRNLIPVPSGGGPPSTSSSDLSPDSTNLVDGFFGCGMVRMMPVGGSIFSFFDPLFAVFFTPLIRKLKRWFASTRV